MIARQAEQIARAAHAGQFRFDNVTPYITHPEAVVKRLEGESEDVLAVAWLHDVLEDTLVTASDLLRDGIPPHVVQAVEILTKPKKSTDYWAYLQQVKSDAIAHKVKVQDILHNLSDSPTRRQIIKYAKALLYLVD